MGMQTTNHTPTTNATYGERLLSAAEAVALLNELDITVLDMDINRVKPVITVQPCRGVNRLIGVVYRHIGTPAGRLSIAQAQLCNCRIEWEVK